MPLGVRRGAQGRLGGNSDEEKEEVFDPSPKGSEASSPASFIDFGGADSPRILPSTPPPSTPPPHLEIANSADQKSSIDPSESPIDPAKDLRPTSRSESQTSFIDYTNDDLPLSPSPARSLALSPSPSPVDVNVDADTELTVHVTDVDILPPPPPILTNPISYEVLAQLSTLPPPDSDLPPTPTSTNHLDGFASSDVHSHLSPRESMRDSLGTTVARQSFLSGGSSGLSSGGSAYEGMLEHFPEPPNVEEEGEEYLVPEEEERVREGQVVEEKAVASLEGKAELTHPQSLYSRQGQHFGTLGDYQGEADEEGDLGSDEDVTLTSVASVATLRRRSLSTISIEHASASLVLLQSSHGSNGSLTEDTGAWTIASTSTDTITVRRLSHSSEELSRSEGEEDHLDMVRRALNSSSRESGQCSRHAFAYLGTDESREDTSLSQPLPSPSFPSPSSFTLPRSRQNSFVNREGSTEPGQRWSGGAGISSFVRGLRKNSTSTPSTPVEEGGRSRAASLASGTTRVLHERIPSDPAVLNPLRRGWESPEERGR